MNIWAPKESKIKNLTNRINRKSSDFDIGQEIEDILEQQLRRASDDEIEDGEINTEDEEEGKETGTESEDDDLDLHTLVNLQKTTSTFRKKSPEQKDPVIEDNEESEDDMKTPEHDPLAGLHDEDQNEDEIANEDALEDETEGGEDALLYSPVDPIANLPFITDFVPDYVPERVTIPDEEIQEIVL